MPQRPIRNTGSTTFLYALAGTLVAAGGLAIWGMPPGLALIVTVALFGWDKRMASRSRGRIPETCLLGSPLSEEAPRPCLGKSFSDISAEKHRFVRSPGESSPFKSSSCSSTPRAEYEERRHSKPYQTPCPHLFRFRRIQNVNSSPDSIRVSPTVRTDRWQGQLPPTPHSSRTRILCRYRNKAIAGEKGPLQTKAVE